MKAFHGRRRSLPVLFVALSVLLLVWGCALIPEEVSLGEPSGYLEYSPQIYARLSGQTLRDITKVMEYKKLWDFLTSLMQNPKAKGGGNSSSSDSTIDTSFIKEFLDKTNSFGAGIRGIGSDQPKAEAIFLGRFSPVSLRLALTMEGSWRRLEDGGYRSAQYPLYLRSPQAGWIHLSTEAGPPPKSEPVQAFPERMRAMASSDIFISINEPKILFSGTLPLEASAIPLETVLLSGFLERPSAPAVPAASPSSPGLVTDSMRNYLVELRVVVKDEATAKAYRPVVRFLWAAAVARIFGNRSDIASLPLSLEGAVYVVRGIRLSGEEIRRILSTGGMTRGPTS
jgi:hypothetical protein